MPTALHVLDQHIVDALEARGLVLEHGHHVVGRAELVVPAHHQ
jgi:hypothetical protein